ncbi:mechanosensitive ion channel family protein [Natronorubrum bangense]|uniref:Mechanosensitive ion channel family protein n=2 Tax=Natronorubrum bangense TaxID=61858 RepID=A0A4D6HGN5_9EURY|nr:mechanosensitive ion channel family protein [Natronorubrum bangense]ELY43215.1 mechanosensitive ion channel MscS [Natronorubrum bangense JCM 10635]QCC53304.1 mechanosensitive ion channel family protein [Natronorubrum bangense]QCC56002.1 mechanosensitive ion channel family protein [Natronorubrum bangense]
MSVGSGSLPLQATDLGAIGTFLEEAGLDAALAASAESAIKFVIAFVAIWIIGRLIVLPLVRRAFDKRDLDKHAQNPLLMLTKFGIAFVAIAIAFGFANYGNFLVSMAGIAAAGALAIGLAMQNVISNFVAGVFIYTDKPFRIGDWIEWDDHSGVVEDISLRVTRVRTFDNELLTVPNSALTNNVLKNPVDADKLRLKFVFGIGYGDDIEQATDIIVDEAERHPGIMDDPAPSVRLTELGDSDVGLQSRFWIANPSRADFVRTRGEYVTAVKERFDEEGIDIPYPVRTLEGGLELADRQRLGQTTD